MDRDRQIHIGRLFLELNKDFTGSAVEIIRKAGFPHVQTSHIFVIAAIDMNGTPLSEVIERTKSSKQAINKVLAQLEKFEFVERSVSKSDSRARIVRFTAKGRQFMKIAMDAVQTVESEYIKIFGRAEFLSLRKKLQELAERRGIVSLEE